VGLAEELMFDALVVKRSKQFLREHRDDPFFLCVGLEKPHPPWWAPAEFHAMYSPEDVDLPDDFGQRPVNVPDSQHWRMEVKDKILERFSAPAARNAKAAYYANVSYMDHKLGQLLSAVDDLGLTENTLVVYTSDHGEMLFDHTLIQKGYMYDPAVAVPLICAYPGHFPAGARRDEIVQLLDLFPTFMDAAGLEHPDGLEGESLLPVARGEADAEGRAAFAEFYSWGSPWRMIRTPGFKYVYQDTEMAQLYDMVNDPCETTNLATDAGFKAACAELHERVMADWEIPPQEEMIPRHGMYPWQKK
jgi:arylsulfatase A-like enzyme